MCRRIQVEKCTKGMSLACSRLLPRPPSLSYLHHHLHPKVEIYHLFREVVAGINSFQAFLSKPNSVQRTSPMVLNQTDDTCRKNTARKINQVKLFTWYNSHVISYPHSLETLVGLGFSILAEVLKTKYNRNTGLHSNAACEMFDTLQTHSAARRSGCTAKCSVNVAVLYH